MTYNVNPSFVRSAPSYMQDYVIRAVILLRSFGHWREEGFIVYSCVELLWGRHDDVHYTIPHRAAASISTLNPQRYIKHH
jgi:hypothetical protein